MITIEVPPLRERPGDIGLLARHFAEQRRCAPSAAASCCPMPRSRISRRSAGPATCASSRTRSSAPSILAAGDVLDVADVAGPRAPAAGAAFATFVGDRVPTLDELERAHILKVLELCDNQKTKAAQMLGINRTTLWKKLRQYGLDGDALH